MDEWTLSMEIWGVMVCSPAMEQRGGVLIYGCGIVRWGIWEGDGRRAQQLTASHSFSLCVSASDIGGWEKEEL